VTVDTLVDVITFVITLPGLVIVVGRVTVGPGLVIVTVLAPPETV